MAADKKTLCVKLNDCRSPGWSPALDVIKTVNPECEVQLESESMLDEDEDTLLAAGGKILRTANIISHATTCMNSGKGVKLVLKDVVTNKLNFSSKANQSLRHSMEPKDTRVIRKNLRAKENFFSCKLCSAEFKCKSNLKVHLYTHSTKGSHASAVLKKPVKSFREVTTGLKDGLVSRHNFFSSGNQNQLDYMKADDVSQKHMKYENGNESKESLSFEQPGSCINVSEGSHNQVVRSNETNLLEVAHAPAALHAKKPVNPLKKVSIGFEDRLTDKQDSSSTGNQNVLDILDIIGVSQQYITEYKNRNQSEGNQSLEKPVPSSTNHSILRGTESDSRYNSVTRNLRAKEKLFSCDQCSAEFKCKSNLMAHSYSHSRKGSHASTASDARKPVNYSIGSGMGLKDGGTNEQGLSSVRDQDKLDIMDIIGVSEQCTVEYINFNENEDSQVFEEPVSSPTIFEGSSNQMDVQSIKPSHYKRQKSHKTPSRSSSNGLIPRRTKSDSKHSSVTQIEADGSATVEPSRTRSLRTKGNLFSCSQCVAQFKCKSNLMVHLYTHSSKTIYASAASQVKTATDHIKKVSTGPNDGLVIENGINNLDADGKNQIISQDTQFFDESSNQTEIESPKTVSPSSPHRLILRRTESDSKNWAVTCIDEPECVTPVKSIKTKILSRAKTPVNSLKKVKLVLEDVLTNKSTSSSANQSPRHSMEPKDTRVIRKNLRTKENFFSCKLCTAKFKCKSNLKVHLYSHSTKASQSHASAVSHTKKPVKSLKRVSIKLKFDLVNGQSITTSENQDQPDCVEVDNVSQEDVKYESEESPIFEESVSNKNVSEGSSNHDFQNKTDSLEVHIYSGNISDESKNQIPYASTRRHKAVATSTHRSKPKNTCMTAVKLRVKENIYTCDQCPAQFKCKSNLQAHSYKHSKSGPFICSLCSLQFQNRANLTDHMATHKDRFACKLCGARFKNKLILRRHLKIHSAEKFRCSHCAAKFTNAVRLKSHLVKHSLARPFSCPKCPKTFKRKNSLTEHVAAHAVKKPICCTNCPARFQFKKELERHLAMLLCGKSLSCEKCNERFRSESHLRRHLVKQHGESPLACSQCPARFKYFSSFRSHLLRHSNERQYPCTQCSERFKVKSELKAHLVSHSNDLSFPCRVCQKRFKSKQYLKQHLVTCSNYKPFICAWCPLGFRTKAQRKKHAAAHFPRPFPCPDCSAQFKSEDGLWRHSVVHFDDILFYCGHCSVPFKTKSTLEKHILTHDLEDTPDDPEDTLSCDEWF